MLLAVAWSCLILCRPGNRPAVRSAEAKVKDSVAELISAEGMVFVGKPEWAETNPIAVGARFMEGDLIQTDRFGGASIRYSNGTTVEIQRNTVMVVRSSGDGTMDIGAPASRGRVSPAGIGREMETSSPVARGTEDRVVVEAFNKARANEAGPFIRLDRIVLFGRSMELVGNVDAGSSLLVNNEIVEVSGDGSFKHFTNPFPSSVRKAMLVMKVTDLAGRARVVETVYDFGSHSGDR